MDYQNKMNEWVSTINKTISLLNANTEWIKRYAEYAKSITNNLPEIVKARRNFNEWAPLRFYLNVTNAKKAKNHLRIEIRFLGQTVAELIYSEKAKINTKKYELNNEKFFGCTITLSNAEWDSPKAAEFRKFFKSLEASGKISNPGNEEHRIENLILTEMAKTKDKALPYMKPVKIGGLRFPMPTPLRASDHKEASYSNQYGGGIDAFARTGTGGIHTNLCIMELKDENEQKEPPKDVIKQALAYTVFIRELLRSESGSAWWKLFGFSGKIPDKLILYSICVMPSNNNNDYSFKNEELNIGGEDTARLHYIYFTESGNRIINFDSSLN